MQPAAKIQSPEPCPEPRVLGIPGPLRQPSAALGVGARAKTLGPPLLCRLERAGENACVEMPGTATKKIAAARPPQPPPSPGPDAAEGMQILYTRPEVMLRILGFLAAPDLVTVALVSKKLQVLTETAAQKIVENKNPQRHLLPDALSVFANLPETCRWKRVACCIECQANFAVRPLAPVIRSCLCRSR